MEAKFLDIGGSKTLRLAARESAEAAIEGALPLPAGIRLGDIEPLCAAARVEAAAATAHDGRIDIEGKLKVSVIFRNAVREMVPSGDGADNAGGEAAAAEKGGAFTSGAAFKYSIACDAAREGMRAEVTAYVTSCTLSAAGELMLSAVAGLDCAVYDTSPLPMLNGIDGAECEMKRECICTCTEALIGQSETDFEAETALPAGTEPLFASGECSVRSVTVGGDTAIIEGQLCLDLLLCSRAGLTAHAVQFPFTIEAELDSRAEGDGSTSVVQSSMRKRKHYAADAPKDLPLYAEREYTPSRRDGRREERDMLRRNAIRYHSGGKERRAKHRGHNNAELRAAHG